MKKAFRIGYNKYYDDAIFEKHLEFVKKYIDVIDEVTLFPEYSHYGYWSEEFINSNSELIKKRIKQYKAIGVKRVGINILCTMGHIEEAWGVLPRAPYQYQVNYDGTESKSCLCPSDNGFLEYIKYKYATYAATGADVIWTDDDIRINNHGVSKELCFCPGCISRFNDTCGVKFTRDELCEKICSDADIKSKWNNFKNDVILRLCDAINKGIKSSNSDVTVGFMYCDMGTPSEWPIACGATAARPGGGFYKDNTPLDLIEKALRVQNEVKYIPESTTDIQYEYEAFNYQQLDRSNHISEIETTLACMVGCNGILYNNDVFVDREGTPEMLRKICGRLDYLAKFNGQGKPCGIYCEELSTAMKLVQIGIPITPFLEKSSAAVIIGNTWNKYSDSKIRQILEKNVLTDGLGLQILNNRGFGALVGGTVRKAYDSGMAERFTKNSLNGEYVDYYRDVYMNFHYESDAYELEPSENVQILSMLERITHEPVGISAYAYERKDGTRFAADGYLMLDSARSYAKKEQINNVLEWLSNCNIPVRSAQNVRILPFTASDCNGKTSIMLINGFFDETGEITLRVNTSRKIFKLENDGSLKSVRQKVHSNHSEITLENIGAWDYVVLVTE